MGAFLAVIMAQVGRRVGGEIVGALAGIIWAVYPYGHFRRRTGLSDGPCRDVLGLRRLLRAARYA